MVRFMRCMDKATSKHELVPHARDDGPKDAGGGYERGHRPLWIVGKGAKPKTRKVSPAVAHAINCYLADRAERAGLTVEQLDGPRFASASGRRLDRKDVYELVERIGRQAGIEGLHPHQLRHTFATLAEESGVGVKKIQAALGHANSATTDIYLEARDRLEGDPSDLVAAAMGSGPRCRSRGVGCPRHRGQDAPLPREDGVAGEPPVLTHP
ncbi:tyrosine-type recombinase/integrase [Nonomuraea sp. NPDC050451]|uniref:tyrosine-type recombinase/integrase n=1 Tax=Nonomuraea sp. NPDC050451 TaxID=3364364 RepID=UPI00378DF48D